MNIATKVIIVTIGRMLIPLILLIGIHAGLKYIDGGENDEHVTSDD